MFKTLRRRYVAASLVLIPFVVGPIATNVVLRTSAQAQGVSSGPLQMSVVESRSVANVAANAPIAEWKYLIVKENTGNPAPNEAACVPANTANCQYPSVRDQSGFDDIVTQGNQKDFAASNPNRIKIEDILTINRPGTSTPWGQGRYLISVLAAGHKLGGAHFTLPLPSSAPVVVKLDAYPIPLATLRMKVFLDTKPVDGTYEAGNESTIEGMTGRISDVLGEVTTDYFGNPLCTQYLRETADPNSPIKMNTATGKPLAIASSPGCLSNKSGDIVIPNLGPDRYATTVVPPVGPVNVYADSTRAPVATFQGADLAQTTTLEGGHDWDQWIAEGASGYDTELVIGSEKVPPVAYGFTPPATASGGTGSVSGRVMEGAYYIPGRGGLNTGPIFPVAGAKLVKPLDHSFVTLSSLANGDGLVSRVLTGADGRFNIVGVPAGVYTITYWDQAQNHILDLQQVTVPEGQAVDLGNLQLQDWFTQITGTVFVDTNENGKRDPGEVGVPNLLMAEKTRNNSIQDQGSNTIVTDSNGFYRFDQTYPLTRYLVVEMFDPRFRSTGITYQADNGPEVTLPGAAVDINALPVIGLSGRIDWGIKPYAPGTNGGIVGTISYDTTRNELDPSKGVAEAYQPGIPDIPVHVYSPPTKVTNTDGSVTYTRGYELTDPYMSEKWKLPTVSKPGITGCSFYDVNGDPIPGYGSPDAAAKGVLANTNPGPCIEAPFMSTQIGHTEGNADGTDGGTLVNGNYGFSDTFRNQYNPDLATTKAINKINVAANPNAIVPLVSAPTTTAASTTAATTAPTTAATTVDPNAPTTAATTIDPNAPTTAATTVDPNAPTTAATTVDPNAPTTVATIVATTVPTTVATTAVTTAATTAATTATTAPPSRPTVAYLPQWAPLHCLTVPPSTDYLRSDDCAKAGSPWEKFDNYDYPNQVLASTDYMVALEIPKDIFGKPLYKPTAEEDVNVFNGDVLYPQENFGAGGAVNGWNPDLAVIADPGPPGGTNPVDPPSQGQSEPVTCAGDDHVVTVTNANFNAGGGSPYEGEHKNYCDALIVKLKPQRSVAPTFLLHTEVPLPTHFWGISINDLSLSYDPKSTNYGEAYGMPNVPVGIYDWKGDLVDTLTTDPNGLYEGIEPSTSSYNCPLPAGPCPSMYRFVANDPGQPGHFNTNYSNRYRTIAADFQAWPGLWTVTDEAPTSVGVTAIAPGTNQRIEVNCSPAVTQPQIFNVNRVQIPLPQTTANADITITGIGFSPTGTTPAVSLVSEDGTKSYALDVVGTPTDRQLVVRLSRAPVPVTGGAGIKNATMAPAPYHLVVQNNPGQTSAQVSTNAITVHVTGGNTRTATPTAANPTLTALFEYDPKFNTVSGNPSLAVGSIQAWINKAATNPGAQGSVLLVPPRPPSNNNPFGAYYENLIIGKKIKLQGFGPGGVYPDGSRVDGSILSGKAWSPDTVNADLADANGLFYTTGEEWFNTLGSQTNVNAANIAAGAVITVVGRNNTFGNVNANVNTDNLHAAIDGFQIREGQQKDFPGNLNAATGQVTPILGTPTITEQGGGIYVHSNARNVMISNNIITANGGAYSAGIRVGTPYLNANSNSNNQNLTIARNAIKDNGGVNLAGGIGIFGGANNYSVRYNDLCGNFSVEYGGAVTHFGNSPNSSIDHNRVWLNESFDEGGGLMIAGQLPLAGQPVSLGTGKVTIDSNVIEANLANDDGGGIRVLQANNSPIVISNNVIANNVSTHEGGGISLDDAAQVTIKNNTIARNITTATAATSDGLPAPAGLSSTNYSQELTAVLTPASVAFSPTFSNPKIFNTFFWENRAGVYNPTTSKVDGISQTDRNIWDVGMVASTNKLTLSYSGTTSPQGPQASAQGFIAGTGNLTFAKGDGATEAADTNSPFVDSKFQVSAQPIPWRRNGNFLQSLIVAADIPSTELGNYHILNTYPIGNSPLRAGAWDPSASDPSAAPSAAALATDATATLKDIDNQCRGTLVSTAGVTTCAYNVTPLNIYSRPDLGADHIPGTVTTGPPISIGGAGLRMFSVLDQVGVDVVKSVTPSEVTAYALAGTGAAPAVDDPPPIPVSTTIATTPTTVATTPPTTAPPTTAPPTTSPTTTAPPTTSPTTTKATIPTTTRPPTTTRATTPPTTRAPTTTKPPKVKSSGSRDEYGNGDKNDNKKDNKKDNNHASNDRG